jgi:hypothetical protein
VVAERLIDETSHWDHTGTRTARQAAHLATSPNRHIPASPPLYRCHPPQCARLPNAC